MAIARRSWIAAGAAAVLGCVLYAYDDLFEQLGLGATATHDVAHAIEFVLLGPGMALLGFTLSELGFARERDVRRAREQADGQRFLALGRVAASVAHEVRNPLHNIGLILGELQPAAADPLWDRLRANLERIDRAVDLVYELARPPARERADDEAVDLARIVAGAIDAARARWPEVAIAADLPAPMPVACRTSPARIMLENLVRNAAAAAGEAGGAVVCAAERDGADWVVRIANAGRLALAPDDPGFTSSKPDGLGLGLYISRQLAANAGGSIDLAQEDDRVVATVRLPAWDAKDGA